MKYEDVLFACGGNKDYASAIWFQIEKLNSQTFKVGFVCGGLVSAMLALVVIFAVRYL